MLSNCPLESKHVILCILYFKWAWHPGGYELTLLVPGNCQLTVEGSPSNFEAGAAWMSVKKAGPDHERCVSSWVLGVFYSPLQVPSSLILPWSLVWKANIVHQTVWWLGASPLRGSWVLGCSPKDIWNSEFSGLEIHKYFEQCFSLLPAKISPTTFHNL